MSDKSGDIYWVEDDGKMYLDFHEGQIEAWDCKKRFIAIIAGTQGGKTSFGPHWLRREISLRGAGDYLVVTPTFVLLKLKAKPEFLKLFEDILQLGTYKKGEGIFYLSAEGEVRMFGKVQDTPTRIIFGHAMNPEGLESATAKAAWLDEAGQNAFKLGSWEAIQRRLSIYQGRALITTTPYNWGWLKTDIYDRWIQAGMNHPDIQVVRFASNMNPMFPEEEFQRAKGSLPEWKFRMFYMAEFTRPAGMIYGDFRDEDVIEPFEIPDNWQRYMGVDFGGVNTAAVYFAFDDENQMLYAYREYHAGNMSIKKHTGLMLSDETVYPQAIGGAPSEDQWRDEFSAAGLYIRRPEIYDVEVGIGRVIEAHRLRKYKIFNTCRGLIEQKKTYSRKVNASGQPIDEIQDKNTYHLVDAERYGMTYCVSLLKTSKTNDAYEELAEMYTKQRIRR